MTRPAMRRTAILSDVHANLEALEAVLEDAEACGCEEIVCLGDLIGYGPNPRQVMRIALDRFEFTLMGNHEEGILYQPMGFNWKAEASAWWTKDQLRSTRFPGNDNEEYWEYLEQMPRYATHGDVLYVHASPLDPTREYVMPEACYNPDFMRLIFSKIKRIAFGGHTHLPGIFFENRPFLEQSKIEGPFNVVRGKYFVNVGSVGQPRDGDTRSSYVVFDGKTVEFRRVEYNYRRTARKIKRIKRLPNALGARLSLGL
ncbi:MAG TPA: metallophosphoesterase family protein [Planctomycetota bacterium]|nr:metallophosphoesterase family protein [Planctomycetota bacterium]